MDGGRMQYSGPRGTGGDNDLSGSAADRVSDNGSPAQAHESVPDSRDRTHAGASGADALSTPESKQAILDGGREGLPKTGFDPTRAGVDSPSVAEGLESTERVSHQTVAQSEDRPQPPKDPSGPSNQSKANFTETQKVKYLKTIRTAWGDDFANGLAWPEPPGKTFLEDVLRLIKNEKVGIEEFRKGVMPIFKERTAGKESILTGWARYISRTDLKAFLQLKEGGNGSSESENRLENRPSMNNFAPDSPQKSSILHPNAGTQNGEKPRAQLSQDNAYTPQETGMRNLTTERAEYARSIPAPDSDKSERYQKASASGLLLDGNASLQTLSSPRNGSTFDARDTPGISLRQRELTGLDGASDRPGKIDSLVNHTPSVQQDVGLEKSAEVPSKNLGAAALYSQAGFAQKPPAAIAQNSQPRQSISSLPSLPKCYTCDNVVSARWYPYLTGPLVDNSNANPGTFKSGFKQIEYQCEECNLKRRSPGQPHVLSTAPTVPSMVLNSQNDGLPSTYSPSPAPQSQHRIGTSTNHQEPSPPVHDGLPKQSEYTSSGSSRLDASGLNPVARSLPPPQNTRTYPYAPAYLPVSNTRPVGTSQFTGGQIMNPSAYYPPATAAAPYQQPYRGLYHSTPVLPIENSMAIPSARMDHHSTDSGHQFTPVNRRSADAESTTRTWDYWEAQKAAKRAASWGTNASFITTKEMGAQKRIFAEVIDLTDDSVVESIERHDRPRKTRKIMSEGSSRDSADVYGGQQIRDAQPSNANLQKTTIAPSHQLTSTHQQQRPLHQSPYFPTVTLATASSSSASSSRPSPATEPPSHIQDTVDKDPAVCEPREYDPRTIASDILVAIGKHPHRPPLNGHLEHFKGHFGIDDFTDLATFSVAGIVKPHDYRMPPPIEEESDSLQTRRLNVARPTRGGHSSGRGGPSGGSTNFTPHEPSSLRHARTPGTAIGGTSVLDKNKLAQGPSEPSQKLWVMVPDGSKASPSVSNSTSVTPKKRGRPFKNNIPPGYTPPTPRADNQSVPSHSSRLVKPFAEFTSGYVPPTTPGESSTQPKKRGRPYTKNFPPGYSAPEHPPSQPKKRSRPFKTDSPEPPVSPVERKFLSFLCEWEDCPADLHNLETLRTHIFVNHANESSNGTITCLWKNCNKTQGHDGILEFRTKKEWEDHVNRTHLQSFAWHMGDGPRGTSLDSGSTSSPRSFLTDLNGREVTPSVKDQRIEFGLAKDNNEKRFRKKREGIHMVLEKIPPSESAVPAVVLERRKPLKGVPVFSGNGSDEEEDGEKTDELTASGPFNMAAVITKPEEEDDDDDETVDAEMEL